MFPNSHPNYSSEEDIRKLYDALNARGKREKVLKENLEKFFNYRGWFKLKSQRFHANWKKQDMSGFWTKKAQIENNFNPFEKDILACRDYILDIEERIFNADFGDAFNDEEQRGQVRSFNYSPFRLAAV